MREKAQMDANWKRKGLGDREVTPNHPARAIEHFLSLLLFWVGREGLREEGKRKGKGVGRREWGKGERTPATPSAELTQPLVKENPFCCYFLLNAKKKNSNNNNNNKFNNLTSPPPTPFLGWFHNLSTLSMFFFFSSSSAQNLHPKIFS